MAIRDELLDQWGRSWDMLRQAIQIFPDEQWYWGDDDYRVPARLAFHAVDTAAYYACESPDTAPTPLRFDLDWKLAEATKLPSREHILQYLDNTRAELDDFLVAQSEAQMLAAHEFHWTGDTVLSRMIYSLRHLQHHVAELNLELHRRGLQSADWR